MKCIVLIVLVCAVALHAYPAPEEDAGDAGGITLEKVGDLDGEGPGNVQQSPLGVALKVGTAITVVPAVIDTLKKGVEAIGDLFGKLFG